MGVIFGSLLNSGQLYMIEKNSLLYSELFLLSEGPFWKALIILENKQGPVVQN